MAFRTGGWRLAPQTQRKIGAFFVVMATIAALLGVNAATASAVAINPGSDTGFEIEGNQLDAANDTAIDWESVIGSPDLTVIDDGEPDTGIGQGAQEQNPAGWGCHTGNPPKDNILQIAIHQRISQQAALLDLASVRLAGNGNTHINFEFNQNPVTFDCSAGYLGRTDGDLLLLLEFPGNGTAAVDAFRWDNTPLNNPTPVADPEGDGAWIPTLSLPVGVATGAENAAIITGAENFLFGGGDIEERAFAEVSLDLGQILGELPGGTTCTHFGSVGARSRASGESITSELKDIVGPTPIDLSTCGGVTIHKTDDAGNPLAGAVFGLFTTQALADTRLAANAEQTCTSLANGSCAFTDVKPGHYFINEISVPAGYSIDTDTVEVDVAFRQTVDVAAPFVDPRDTGFVKVTKALVDQNNQPVTPGNLASLNGATFLLYTDGNGNSSYDAGEEVHLWPNPPADGSDLAGCTITNSLGFCSFGPVATGSYRLTETAVPAQTNKGADIPVTVTKGTVQTPVSVTYTNALNPLQINLEKSGPPTANIGDIFNYTFAVTTSGPPLHDISVVELAPFNDRCNNGPITGPVKTGGDQDTFLEVGETWTYTCSHLTTPADGASLLNRARATGTDDFGRTISDDDDHTVTINYPNLQVVKTAVQSPVNSGSAAGFSITTTNLGPGTALNVTATDTLPAGTWTIGGADGGACSGTTGTMTCSFGTMVSGASKVVTLSRATTIADCGTLHNTVSVATTYSGANIDSSLTNNTSSADVAVNCPDVEVTKVAEASPISAGDTARFTITVHNSGSGNATGVTISDPLPSLGGLTWVIDSQSAGMGCTVGASLSCGPFNLTANETKVVVISAVTAPANCGLLPNTVTITVAGGDTNAANNSDSDSITVLCPNLGITKVADAASVSAGDPIGFTIVVTNSGDGVAKAVGLNDPLPSGVDWTITAPVPTGCAIANGTLSCTPRDLVKNASLTIHITAATTQDDCKAYSNTATADGSNTAPVQATATTLVLCPGLNILKTADAPAVDAGSQIGFTITVANGAGEGIGTAKGVTLHDVLPISAGISWSIASQTGVAVTCTVVNSVLDCGPVDLAPGESFAVHIVSPTPSGLTNDALPLACKAYDNTAVADATNASEVTASATTTVVCPLAIQIVKDGPATAQVGDTVTYTFAVTNIGKVDLVKVDLSDAKCDAGTITQTSNGDGDSVLTIGETWKYACIRIIRADDPDPLPNTATVVGTDSRNRTTQATDDHLIDLVQPPQVLPEEIVRALPRTGMDPRGLLFLAAIFLSLGGFFLWSSKGEVRPAAVSSRTRRTDRR